jgi:hypothetical protein
MLLYLDYMRTTKTSDGSAWLQVQAQVHMICVLQYKLSMKTNAFGSAWLLDQAQVHMISVLRTKKGSGSAKRIQLILLEHLSRHS